MELSYSSNKLEKQLTQDKVMRREYSEPWIKKIQLRIAELRVAVDLEELQNGPGRWHALKGDHAGEWAGDVSGNYRMIITPITDGPILRATAVRVEKIYDYH